ncbi:hypothetical protein BGZ82_007673 [Podila clonocystis]|nr:hypothetical protein BGZ82_007673 [Podila clonocystis]
MTGEEAYHADCFRCIQCESKIDDLVFAKTSQGIYCMKCHQERKEAKRQREERERMERAERMMEKLLPTIPEGEQQKRPNHSADKPLPPFGLSPYDNNNTYVPQTQYQQHNQQTSQNPKISRPDFNGSQQHPPPKFTPTPRTDSRKPNNGLPSVDMGPPFLPPLKFDFEDTASSGFDLGDMLGSDTTTGSKESGSKDKEKEMEKTIIIETPSSPISPRDSDLAKAQEKSTYRISIGRASARLSVSSADTSERSSLNNEGTRPSSESPEPGLGLHPKGSQSQLTVDSIPHSRSSQDQSEHDTMSSVEAAAMIRELRMELAKYNPMSPLLHGTPQQEYGMLLKKTEELTAKHNQLEKSLRDLYIEKDLLGMDLEVMNTELKAKEEALASDTPVDRLQPPTPNPRMSTSHDFMKQAYQVEVKALQEQKEKLQKDIQMFVEQREGVLNEMQILSVRNAELSTMNNDMMREMQGRMDTKPSGPPPSMSSTSNNGGMLQSFTDKIRRQRQHSGGNQHELRANHIAGSNDSTYSFTSTGSDDRNGRQGSGETVYKARKEERKEERQEDIFGEEIIQPKKFNWKKGTTNTVKNVGAMFGKLLVESPGGNTLEVPNGRGPSSGSDRQMLSDNGSSNGQILPPRSFSSSSETRSLNGSRYSEQHYFIQHNYIRPTRCEYCDDKMWGREYKCRNCGFQIHGRCTHEIIPGCSGKFKDSDSNSLRNVTPSGGSAHGSPPTPPAKQIMFGNGLLDQLELEQRSVPLVVEKCIEAVDERGLEVEGIYRRSGMAAEARQLVQAYDSGMHPDLMDSGLYQDICSITSVLKQYLRTLPEPLIPYDMYDDFMEAISLPQNDAKIQTFKDLMERMPFAYYQTLKVLLEHLNRVRELDHINLMNAKNLSVVFGPTLMRNPDSSREILDMTFKNMTIEFFITNTTELFVRNERPSTSSNASGASGGMLPHPGMGQRQGSIGSIPGLNNVAGHMSPPPRRAQTGGPNGASGSTPMLPPRSLSGDTIPTASGFNPQSGQQPAPGQQFQPYRPQAFPQPQHQTLQQLKQQVQLQQQQHQLQQQVAAEQETPVPQSQTQSPAQQPQQLTPPPSQGPSAVSSPFPQQLPQQQANPNPEVDMTNFP